LQTGDRISCVQCRTEKAYAGAQDVSAIEEQKVPLRSRSATGARRRTPDRRTVARACRKKARQSNSFWKTVMSRQQVPAWHRRSIHVISNEPRKSPPSATWAMWCATPPRMGQRENASIWSIPHPGNKKNATLANFECGEKKLPCPGTVHSHTAPSKSAALTEGDCSGNFIVSFSARMDSTSVLSAPHSGNDSYPNVAPGFAIERLSISVSSRESV